MLTDSTNLSAEIPISDATRVFIADHADEDIRELALHAPRDNSALDIPFALDQIAGRHTARTKLPEWASCDGIVYPPHLSMEQCSSQATACIKADIAHEITAQVAHPTTLVDLTGGFGVDFSYIARVFDHAIYVEQNEYLCALARHNLHELGVNNAQVIHNDGMQYLQTMLPATMIYVDPARRDSHGGRTYAISDCTPDVLALQEELLAKAPIVMVKLSPMLDWRKTIEDFAGAVSRLYVISSGNECKEILLILTRTSQDHVQVICINDNERLQFHTDENQRPTVIPSAELDNMQYLYEPNASIMKAGAFAALQQSYAGLQQIGTNSHLFVSKQLVPDFPGRVFEIMRTGTMNKRDIKQVLQGITHANIAVRNFPLTVQQLRKKTKLKDGGSDYIFATTDESGRHIVLLTHKI